MSIYHTIQLLKSHISYNITNYFNTLHSYNRLKTHPKPTTLNLMVTDTCNSHCLMCNVWKNKKKKEFTIEEFSTILQDPLWDKLEHVGVSGGEPTLRQDLPQIFQVITSKKSIRGVSLITNGLNADTVISQVGKCYVVCKNAGIPFSLMVSLDGLNKIHNLVRGRTRAFENSIKVIRHFRDNSIIPLTVACTVVKENVWFLDELLDFCKKEKLYIRFRIAEFIERLENKNLTNSIRNFNTNEKYQIALFFSKLYLTYEKDPSVKATYRNICRMIFEGLPRESGCPYRSSAVGLTSSGDLLFCSPKSPVIGSCIKHSALNLYKQNNHTLQDIIKKYCRQCIHDYHASPASSLIKENKDENYFRKKFSVNHALKKSKKIPSPLPQKPDWSSFSSPLIVGWYGTETAGDKAILGTIIQTLQSHDKNCRITVASLYPFITKKTLQELNIEANIVKTYSHNFIETCKKADAIIMGGGPLMSMEPLGFVLKSFLTARKHDIPTIVYGCGIGPLSDKKYVSTVKEILRLSTSIHVRDTFSLNWVIKNTGRKDSVCSGDPAVDFVNRWKNSPHHNLNISQKPYFACFLREITTEYAGEMNSSVFYTFKQQFEHELGRMISYFSEKEELKPLLLPMHTFTVGGDDRDFLRMFAKNYLNNIDYELWDKIYSPEDILTVMKTSKLNICMRFHSVLFADTLNTPFLAIDYTGGGKITHFLKDRNKENLKIDRAILADGRWEKKIANALTNETN